MTLTASTLLDHILPAWRASSGIPDTYFEGFVSRNRTQLLAMLEPLAQAMAEEPTSPTPACSICGKELVDGSCSKCSGSDGEIDFDAVNPAPPDWAKLDLKPAEPDTTPRPVIMAYAPDSGAIILAPFDYLAGSVFQRYREATRGLRFVENPIKGQFGPPDVAARAVAALERGGFEVRADSSDTARRLVIVGGLDHALPIGPPEKSAGVATAAATATRAGWTTDPALIARVQALAAAEAPPNVVRFLLKVLRQRDALPLSLRGTPLHEVLEEAEGKVARRAARRPKAQRLQDSGGERGPKNAVEEHAVQGLIQLANMDPDKAKLQNDEGFAKNDVATGHALARRFEATGELSSDEWAWAIAAARKYQRQVGLPPKSTSDDDGEEITESLLVPPAQAVEVQPPQGPETLWSLVFSADGAAAFGDQEMFWDVDRDGSGYDWQDIVAAELADRPDVLRQLQWDPESSMLVAYATRRRPLDVAAAALRGILQSPSTLQAAVTRLGPLPCECVIVQKAE